MNRVMWYPNWTHREAVERLLEKLLELERENKITLWADEDENGKRFYDIRELPNETTPNTARTRRGAGARSKRTKSVAPRG